MSAARAGIAMLALLLVAAAPPAMAQTARSSAVINACVDRKGNVRVKRQCRRGERRLRLVALPADPGPQGPKGDKGDRGDPGPAGAPGATGATGADGAASPAYSAGTGLDLAGTVFSLEVPLTLSANPLSSPVLDVLNTRADAVSTVIEGTADSTFGGSGPADGVTGVTGVVSSTAPGAWSAGVRGLNDGTTASGIGVAGVHDGSGWGVYGETAGPGFGVYGQTLGVGGAGVVAEYAGAANGDALRIVNGAIRVGGTNRPAFRHTVATRCGSANEYAPLDNELFNGDPNAMLFVTHTQTTATTGFFPDLGVAYSSAGDEPAGCPTNRWLLYNETGSAIVVGTQVNVLTIGP